MIRRKHYALTLNKITSPRLPITLERKRLFRMLDEARRRPIVWITAPPGMGKTTLAASYIQSRKLKTLWYQIDEDDSDPATFFHYLRLACKTFAPRYKQPLPHLFPEYLPSLSSFTRRFFEKLYARLKPPNMMILDNYHSSPQASPIHEILAIGLNNIPAGITVLILSRTEPPPALAKLFADQLIHVFSTDSLRLTLNETRALYRLTKGTHSKKFPSLGTKELHANTQGWIAGIILSMQQREIQRPCHPSPSETPEVIFDYLAREVFQTLTTKVQKVLLKTAFFSSLTEEMANSITGEPEAGKILADLYRRRYFTERRLTPEAVYQFHPLFREFLKTCGSSVFNKKALQTIKRRTANLLMGLGKIEEAAELYQEMKRHKELEALILHHAQDLIDQGRHQMLREWLSYLPPSQLHAQPWLLFWLAHCKRIESFHESQTLFEQAFERFQRKGQPEGLFITWARLVEGIVIQWIPGEKLDHWLEMLPTLIRDYPTFPSKDIETQVKLSFFSALWSYRPESSFVKPLLEEITKMITNRPTSAPTILVEAHIVAGAIQMGEYRLAKLIVGHISKTIQNKTASPAIQLSHILAQILLTIFNGTLTETEKVLRRGYQLIEEEGVELFRWLLWNQHSTMQLVHNNIEAAQELLSRLDPVFQQVPSIHQGFHYYQRAWLSLMKGQYQNAKIHAEAALENVMQYKSPHSEGWIRLLLTMILHRNGEKAQARQQFTRVSNAILPMQLPMLQFALGLVESLLAQDHNREHDARHALIQTMNLGQHYQIYGWLGLIKEDLALLCAKALEWNIEKDYVHNLIRKWELTPEDPRLASHHWPWPVKIRSLGAFKVEVNGQVNLFGRKVPRRVLALLQAIIAFGGQQVPEVKLMDALWPEADGDRAYRAYATALHRLRKLLGQDNLILVNDRKVSLNLYRCWVDVWSFEHMAKLTQETHRLGDLQGSKRWAEQARALYHGPFLENAVDSLWAEPFRDRLSKQLNLLPCDSSP